MDSKDAILKDKLLSYAEDLDNNNRDKLIHLNHFNKYIQKEKILLYPKEVHGILDEITDAGYLIADDKVKREENECFRISSKGVRFLKQGGYLGIYSSNLEEAQKKIKQEKKLDQINKLNIMSLKWDIPIKIITGVVAIAGLIISIIALSRN